MLMKRLTRSPGFETQSRSRFDRPAHHPRFGPGGQSGPAFVDATDDLVHLREAMAWDQIPSQVLGARISSYGAHGHFATGILVDLIQRLLDFSQRLCEGRQTSVQIGLFLV